ncbi:MAG: ATP-binding protein [Myxococcota bacterium]
MKPTSDNWLFRVVFGLGLALVVAFTFYCWDLVQNVSRLREEVTQRVTLLIAVQALQEELGQAEALDDGDRTALLAARVAVARAHSDLDGAGLSGPMLRETLDASFSAVDELASGTSADPAAARGRAVERLGAAVGLLRRGNGASSAELGDYWDSLYLLAVVALGLCVLTLLLLALFRGSVVRLREADAKLRDRLLRSEKDFHRVIEASPDGIVMHRKGVIVYANPAIAWSLGYKRDELLERRLSEFLDDPPARRTGHVADGQHRFTRADGRVAELEVTTGPEVQFDGKLTALTVTRDVSEVRLAEAQLRLSDRLAAVGTVTAGVAHEINNPLAYVLLNAESLEERLGSVDDALSPEERDHMATLLSELKQGATQVREVVRGLRSLAHPGDEPVRAIELGPVIESSLAIASSELRQRAEIVREIAADLPPVRGNEALLGQVFLNLLVNAAQALEDSESSRNKVVIRAAQKEGGWVVVEVEDNGEGIPDAVRERVFDPFFTTKRIGVGTGLGLTICRRIVEGLGGAMSIDSEDGQGTTVGVRFPVADVTEVAPEEAAPLDESARVARVLIVDDDARVARALARMLRPNRCDVVLDGQEAIQQAQREEYDVIFCDLMMPDTTGMDVYDALVATGTGIENKLVFVTGGAFTDRARAFVGRVPNPIVEKPFDRGLARRLVSDRVSGVRPVPPPG